MEPAWLLKSVLWDKDGGEGRPTSKSLLFMFTAGGEGVLAGRRIIDKAKLVSAIKL